MSQAQGSKERRPKKRALWGVALAAILAGGLTLVLVLSGGDDSPSDPNRAEVLSVEELREAVSGARTPVYWAGEQAGTELELTQPDAEHTYVRYLTGGAHAGDPRPAFLTVATYTRPNPVRELRKQGRQPGAVLGEAPGGAVVYYDRSKPQSIYLAYPGVTAQIEVYDPDAKQALRLVDSGQIVVLG